MKEVTIYTDGSCLGNPGAGGWAAVLQYGKHTKELVGNMHVTTNNRMELMAVIEGLKALKVPCKVKVVTDSKYVVDAFNKGWVTSWKMRKFSKVKNKELWKELISLTERHQVEFEWVKGHDGHEMNEYCDKMARKAAKEVQVLEESAVSE